MRLTEIVAEVLYDTMHPLPRDRVVTAQEAEAHLRAGRLHYVRDEQFRNRVDMAVALIRTAESEGDSHE